MALDEGGPQPPGDGVEGHAGAGDAAPDDEDVEALVGQAAEGGGAVEAHRGDPTGR